MNVLGLGYFQDFLAAQLVSFLSYCLSMQVTNFFIHYLLAGTFKVVP